MRVASGVGANIDCGAAEEDAARQPSGEPAVSPEQDPAAATPLP